MAAPLFVRAAEILVHTWTGWTQVKVEAFKDLLWRAFVPLVSGGCLEYNGNWELVTIDATLTIGNTSDCCQGWLLKHKIGVFLDSKDLFNRALSLWRSRVPAYLYLASDGPLPHQPAGANWSTSTLEGHWKQHPTGPGPWPLFKDGLCQETCRDLGHVQMGLSAMMNAAETAYHQGVALFDEQHDRIVTALEFHASLLCKQVRAGACSLLIPESVEVEP